MKKTYRLLVILTLFATSACQTLNVEPKSSWSDSSYYANEEQLKALLYGGYTRMQGALGCGFLVYGTLRSDEFYCYNTSKVDYDNIVNNGITPYNSLTTWTPFYQIVQQANLVLKYAPIMVANGKVNAESADDIIGQAYCMRAFAYFWITRIWGAAPLVLTPSEGDNYDTHLRRSSADDVLTQIHSDLLNARQLLSDSGDRFHFTKTAACAIEAQVCAWEGDWNGVLSANRHILNRDDSQLINNKSYSLVPFYDSSYTSNMNLNSEFYTYLKSCDYIKIFNEGNSAESIFELSYSVEDNSVSTSFYGMVGQGEAVRPTNQMKNMFNSLRGNDWRFFVNFYGNNPRWTKYFVNFTGVLEASRNVVLLRLADFVLLEAEALVNSIPTETDATVRESYKKTAVALVNLIRNRAGGTSYELNADDYDVADIDALLAMVANERLLELYGEGCRYFDLVRTGKVLETMQPINGQNDLRSTLWPVYYTELLYGGNIEQNEYYK